MPKSLSNPLQQPLELTATPTPEAVPQARASAPLNVRGGPGTNYQIVGGIQTGEELDILAKNEAGDWWEVALPDGRSGWVYGPLVTALGDVSTIEVAANIPEPPPTAIPEPVAAPAPVAEVVAEEPAAATGNEPHFRLAERRLWSKQENGGCQGQHLLRIHVLDANGVRLNGVAMQGIYIGEVLVTGAQGKGDGIIEYDLHGSGEGFFVLRDTDGREATSDRAEGFTTRSRDIDKDTLIAAGYCSNSADCDVFYGSYGCHGHHSWEATFIRAY